jgi:hypothetical protein
MEQNKHLIPEERARITKIQDLLIERYVEQKEALDEGNRCRAMELEFEIKELLHEKRASSSGGCLTGLGDEIRPPKERYLAPERNGADVQPTRFC